MNSGLGAVSACRILLVASVITAAASPSSQLLAADRQLQVFVLDPVTLGAVKTRLQASDLSLRPAFDRLVRDAERALKTGTPSVIDKEITPPSGDKHDYMSFAPYWWPNPDTSDGKPYILRDGQINPEREKVADHKHFEALVSSVKNLALASFLSAREDFAVHCASMLRVWFLQESTKMNPHLRYAQAVPGRNDGSVSGLIESHTLPAVIDSVALLGGFKVWSPRDQQGLQDWFRAFLKWLLESPQGHAEAKAQNNHGTWYDVQTASFALFVGDRELAKNILREFPAKRIARQIEPDGRQPLELKRTRAWSYSLFNLEALFDAASIGEKVGMDLWNYATPDGRSIRKALDWLVSFAVGDQKWTYPELSGWRPERLASLLRRAALRYPGSRYEQAMDKVAIAADDRLNLLYPMPVR